LLGARGVGAFREREREDREREGRRERREREERDRETFRLARRVGGQTATAPSTGRS
jgi:hypothetical protein